MLHVTCDVINVAAMHFALCQNLLLFLVNLHLKTLETKLNLF